MYWIMPMLPEDNAPTQTQNNYKKQVICILKALESFGMFMPSWHKGREVKLKLDNKNISH